MTDEQTQELMAKFDPEAGHRRLTGLIGWIALAGLVGFSVFQLYTAIFGVFTAQLQRSIHLAFALGLIFLLFPASKKKLHDKTKGRFQVAWYDGLLAIIGVYVGMHGR